MTCACGCGSQTTIATMTNARWGHVKGQPIRYVRGHHKRKARPDVEGLDLAWLAGLLEGEGSFIAAKRRRARKGGDDWFQLTPRISVGMTADEDVIQRVALLLGGKTYQRYAKPGHKPIFTTHLDGAFALLLMARLKPLMGRRRQQQIAEVMERCDRPSILSHPPGPIGEQC